MLKFYFNGSPNPTKVALYLEEAGLPFEPVKIDTRTGEQFTPDYLKINPNGKVPAIDDNGTIVFDSNAILLYLAEKTGKFLPAANVRGEMLSWLMFVATGVGPYSGQAVHFKHFAPKDQNHDYAHNRYQFETDRHYKILDGHLKGRRYMVGELFDRRHGAVGVGADGAVQARRRCLRAIPEREAAGGRDLGAACGDARDRAEGQVHLQGGNGRRGAQQHVQAHDDESRLIVSGHNARPRACAWPFAS